METRDAFKKVVHFANWEYKEKRPKSVKILRLKSKSTITLGALPEFQMRTIGPIIYLVVSDQGDGLMIYFFNRNGERTGGQHYDPTTKFIKKLHKSTVVKYQLPRKERKELIDSTYIFQQDFSKIHQSISNKLGIVHKYLYTVLVDKNLQFSLTQMFGSKRIRKELHIPLQIKEKNYLELVATIEWFYSYLTSSILKPEGISILYDLAILLSAVFNLKFLDKISVLSLSPQNITIHNITFALTKEVKLAISTLSKAKSQKDLITLLMKFCNLLKVLNRYKISLSLLELVHLLIFSCEMFNTETDFHIFYARKKEGIATYFYFRVFTRVHELAKQFNLKSLENKAYFLSMLFGLRHSNLEKIMQSPYTLAEVIENIGILIKDPYIYEPIQRIDNFVSDIISEYIFQYLECKIQYAIEADTLDSILEIQNNSNYVLLDFEYELLWKPKKRIQLTNERNKIQSQDLHQKLRKNYLFKINNKGMLTFSCKMSFTNPLFQDKTIGKNIHLQKISLP